MSASAQHWDRAVRLMEEMVNSTLFDEWERDYKLSIGQRMADVRIDFLGGKEWLPELKRTLQQNNNLPNWRENSSFFTFVEQNPDLADELLHQIWNKDASSKARIDTAASVYPAEGYLSTNFLSVLNLANGASDNPPYKPTAFSEAAKHLGVELPRRNVRTQQGDIYQDALDFMDRVIAECEARGLQLRDRLDAQGIIWTIGTQNDGFPDWSSEVMADYKDFRGDTTESDAMVDNEQDPEPSGQNVVEEIDPTPQLSLAEIINDLHGKGLRLDERTIRRYHIALASRGFVILAGNSGTGKTWLASTYADVTGAALQRVAVAPNWTTNEDLIGYFNPVDGTYHHTETSNFLRQASREYQAAVDSNREPRQFHLLLDEMNLARIEHYFATFLSAIEEVHRTGSAEIPISNESPLRLTPNLKLIGTVNIDETTHGFADKVYDRAQLIELELDEVLIRAHIGTQPWSEKLMSIWQITSDTAPFAFRVIDDIARYVTLSMDEGVSWQDALDEQIDQKILTKLSGNQSKMHGVLDDLRDALGEDFPLSTNRLERMIRQHDETGFVSFF